MLNAYLNKNVIVNIEVMSIKGFETCVFSRASVTPGQTLNRISNVKGYAKQRPYNVIKKHY